MNRVIAVADAVEREMDHGSTLSEAVERIPAELLQGLSVSEREMIRAQLSGFEIAKRMLNSEPGRWADALDRRIARSGLKVVRSEGDQVAE